jgi:phage terminase small subunit
MLYKEYAITDSAGLLILQGIAEAFDRMRKAQKIVADEGETVTDRFNQIRPHPMIAVERDCRSAILRGLKALNIDLEPLNDTIGRPPGR